MHGVFRREGRKKGEGKGRKSRRDQRLWLVGGVKMKKKLVCRAPRRSPFQETRSENGMGEGGI